MSSEPTVITPIWRTTTRRAISTCSRRSSESTSSTSASSFCAEPTRMPSHTSETTRGAIP